jgi:hypothetical protein
MDIKGTVYYQKLLELERKIITQALIKSKSVSEAAIKLGLKRSTLSEKMKILNMKVEKRNNKIFKVICFSILISLIQACSSTNDHSHSSATPIQPDPSLEKIGVVFKPVEYYTTPSQRLKIISAGKKVNEVIQSRCFSEYIASRKLIQTGSKTPPEVSKHLQSLSGEVPVKMYYRRFTSAVAYVSPPDITINLNTKYFTPELSDCDYASTLAHEASHSLGGYSHDFKWSPPREFSVPYSINHAFEKCCK